MVVTAFTGNPSLGGAVGGAISGAMLGASQGGLGGAGVIVRVAWVGLGRTASVAKGPGVGHDAAIWIVRSI